MVSFVFLGSVIIFNLGFVSNIPVIGLELYRKVAIYVRELDTFKAEIGFGVCADILIIFYYLVRRERYNQLDKLWALAFMSACFHIAFYFMPAFSRFNYFQFYLYLIYLVMRLQAEEIKWGRTVWDHFGGCLVNYTNSDSEDIH